MSDTPEVSTVANRLSLRKLFIATVATLTGLALTWVVLTAKSEPQAGPPPDRPAPMVAIIEAAPSTHQLLVHTQGTIDAKRRVDLVAQVVHLSQQLLLATVWLISQRQSVWQLGLRLTQL